MLIISHGFLLAFASILAIKMSQLTCDNCQSEFATLFCPCSYPALCLCPNCCSKHQSEPLHHLLPISQVTFVKTQDNYQALLTRLSNIDQVKIALGKDVSQISMWKVRLQNPQISEDIQTKNKQYLDSLQHLLQPIFDSSLEDVKNNIANDNYQPLDDIKMTIWGYVLGTNPEFLSLLVNADEAETQLATASFHVEVNSLMPSLRQYRPTKTKPQGAAVRSQQSVTSETDVLIQERNKKSDEQAKAAEIQQLKEAQQISENNIRMAAELQANRTRETEARLRQAELEAKQRQEQLQARQTEEQRGANLELESARLNLETMAAMQTIAENPRSQPQYGHSGEKHWKNSFESQCHPITVCCTLCGCCILWPCIGVVQCLALMKVNGENRPCSCLGCCCTTMCLCVGAALNRTYIRNKKGIKGSCIIDLLLYSLHVLNCCLVCQESQEVNKL